jgi:threonylcarbamoyladenosine tRNA methylthiotransferase MtaB
MSGPEIVTFGCRLNAFEAETMRALTQGADMADTVIVNTCAVTAEAERQARQAIRRIRRERPDARIVVTGCAAQIRPETFAAMPEVDRVVGNREKLDVATWRAPDRGIADAPALAGHGAPDTSRVAVSDIMAVRETAPHLLAGFDGRARAFLEVQHGCDHRCTFCIIPFARGNSRSAPFERIAMSARRLVAAGCREVVLTGVDLTAYGADLPGRPTLGQTVRRLLAAAPDLPRLRLSSLDVAEVDDDLLRAFAEEPRLMPHLHLSLQAGDDLILKRMKRRHTRRQAIDFCAAVRRLRPDVVFGADFIAGFPTETEAMFQNTLRLVDDCGLTWLHVFPFSARAGTPAARMPQVPGGVARERAARLRQAGALAAAGWSQSRIGAVAQVLVEQGNRGHDQFYAAVDLDAPCVPGALVEATVIAGSGGRLTARIAA